MQKKCCQSVRSANRNPYICLVRNSEKKTLKYFINLNKLKMKNENKKFEYKGQNIEFTSTPCVISCEGYNLEGNSIIVGKMNGETFTTTTTEDFIWIQEQDDDFQNIWNFVHGIELIDRFATPTVRQKCFDVLMQLKMGNKMDITPKSKLIAFFCEVGVWGNKELRNKDLYHKDFRKYLWNCRWNYYLLEDSGVITTPMGKKIAYGTAE